MTVHLIDFRPVPKVYRRHNCERQHRTYLSFARCVWKSAEWVREFDPGTELRYAMVSNCRKSYRTGNQRTVSLWASREHAEAQREWIDRTGCGGGCYGAHEVIRLEIQP